MVAAFTQRGDLAEVELALGAHGRAPRLNQLPKRSASAPNGKTRQIMVDIDPRQLQAKGLTPQSGLNALGQQNLILPTGTLKVGALEYDVALNGSPRSVKELNDLPIPSGPNGTIFIRDVAHVPDGFAMQTTIARQEGRRSVVLSVLKNGDASTVEVAKRVRDLLPTVKASAPPGMEVNLLSDQSTFVTGAIEGLLVEGAIAAFLTACTILLFLGSFRSTLIVIISIPLSIMYALLVMRAMGETLNVMTLGGLALAIGILVDDATVEIENVEAIPLPDVRIDPAQRLALVFGNELNGVADEVIAACYGCLVVPQHGSKHSLNVSVCAGVVLWHCLQAGG